jgi:hypothetical protein
MQEKLDENKTIGFKVGEYFVSLPPGEFIVEDKNGMGILLDIYKIDRDKAVKVKQGSLPKEVEEHISEEIIKYLTDALKEDADK